MIKVAEHFLSIQGEGATVGNRAVFLRTSGCVLDCKWCDTTEVWKQGTSYTVDELFALFEQQGYTEALLSGAHLVITGGDPLMWQKPLARFVKTLNENLIQCFVEVETEAMLVPTELVNHVNLWNVSPKLSNAGTKAYSPTIVKMHNQKPMTSIFKFVVGSEDDVLEAVAICRECQIESHKAFLMPLASSRAAYAELSPKIVALALKYRFNFSPREHLTIWDQTTGV